MGVKEVAQGRKGFHLLDFMEIIFYRLRQSIRKMLRYSFYVYMVTMDTKT